MKLKGSFMSCMIEGAKELDNLIKLAIALSTDNFIGAAIDVY